MNLPGGWSKEAAEMFGWLVAHCAQEGGTISFTELHNGDQIVGYEFGKEAPDSDMAGGAAYGRAPTLEGALCGVLADMGVDEIRVEPL